MGCHGGRAGSALRSARQTLLASVGCGGGLGFAFLGVAWRGLTQGSLAEARMVMMLWAALKTFWYLGWGHGVLCLATVDDRCLDRESFMAGVWCSYEVWELV